MVRTIEVYVMNKEVITSPALQGRPLTVANVSTTGSALNTFETEKVLSEEDKTALKLVKEFAAEKNLRFRVIDVAGLKGKLRARLKGVKATPTIIVGNNRLIGVPKKEEFERVID
jgi:hypothetical protein